MAFSVHFIEKKTRLYAQGPKDSKSALIQIMGWHRTDDTPLLKPVMSLFTDACMRH